jgi:predicted transcriptional regulator
MAIGEDKIRVQVIVDRSTAKRIEELAKVMNTSMSRMAAALLEAGIEDNEWIIKNVSAPVRRLVDGWKHKSKGVNRATS